MDSQPQTTSLDHQPHLVLLPLPLQGPINCFLKLAQLLCHSCPTLHVTFLNNAFVHRRLPDLPARFTGYPNFRFVLLDDGLPGNDPRPAPRVSAMFAAVEAAAVHRLPELAAGGGSFPPVSCVVADGMFIAVGKAAMAIRVPVVYFSTLSPNCVWINSFLVPQLVDAGKVPFKTGDDLDEPVTCIPGTETSLRRRDLPGICRTNDITDPYIQLVLRECRELPNAQGHILNTFDDLEGPLLPHLHTLSPNVYNIGPLHLLLKGRLDSPEYKSKTQSCFSLWLEDRNCIAWLDAQPSKSVIFVSIGSIVEMTMAQAMEIWYGLVNSGARFLWVRRPGSIQGVEGGDEWQMEVPKELLDATNERGFLVSWAPQEEVLAHPSIGGFLTHSGWNSTLESIVEGVPMLCWPNGIDQQVISRFVEQVWKVGIDMKDKCDRLTVEKLVRDLMVTERRVELSENATMLSKLAVEAVKKDGSSWCALDKLIEDIKSMRLQVPT